MKKYTFRFAVIILASAILWQWVFALVCAPKKHETLQVFVTATRCDTAKIKNALGSLSVKEISVFSQSVENNHYNDYLTTVGILECDLLIVDSDIFELEYAWREFAPLDADLLSQYGLDAADYSFVTVDGTDYAIVIHDETMGISLLEDYLEVCAPGRQYCIAVNKNTPNAAPYSAGETTTDHAFQALAALLK